MPGRIVPKSYNSQNQSVGEKVTPDQAYFLWRSNNPTLAPNKRLAEVMVAIAGAESGYRTNADNGIAAGLWQINYHAHPQWTAQELYNPDTNAKAAGDVYRSQGLGAWDTYTSGAYRQFLPAAKMAVTNDIPDPISSVANAVGSAASSAWSAATAIPRFLGDLGSLLFTEKGWMRLLKLFAGIALGIIALHSLFKDTAVYQAGKKAAIAAA